MGRNPYWHVGGVIAAGVVFAGVRGQDVAQDTGNFEAVGDGKGESGGVLEGDAVEAVTEAMGGMLLDVEPRVADGVLRQLRALRDERLTPMFAQLASSQDTLFRLHGVLGLAELEGGGGGVDLLLVKVLDDPREQALILGEAMERGELTTQQLEDISRWPTLDETLRVLMLVEMRRRGVDVPMERFEAATRSGVGAARVVGAVEVKEGDVGGAAGMQARRTLDELLVADKGGTWYGLADTDGDEAVSVRRLFGTRDEGLRVVLGHIAAGGYRGCRGYVLEVAGLEGLMLETRVAALACAMAVGMDGAGVERVFSAAWDEAALASDRVGIALAVFDGVMEGGTCSTGVFEWVQRHEGIVGDVGRAAQAVFQGQAGWGDMERMSRHGHAPTARHAMQLAQRLCERGDAAERERVLGEVLRVYEGRAGVDSGAWEVVGMCAAMMAVHEPGALLAWFEGAPSAEGVEQQQVDHAAGTVARRAALVGLSSVLDNASAGGDMGAVEAVRAVVEPMRVWAGRMDPATRGLWVIVMDRAGAELGEREVGWLRKAALGEGGLSERWRVLAGWLWLVREGEMTCRVALARMLAEVPGQ